MIKKLLSIIGILGASVATSSAMESDGPYNEKSTNLIYHLLFCDDLVLYQNHFEGEVAYPWSTIFATHHDLGELSKIAEDPAQESRVRALAFNLLRSKNHKMKNKVLLGTIVEVALPDGLDTLAVFADKSVRYINHSGKIIVVEGTTNDFRKEINSVIEASKPIVSAIGPWDKERLDPPPQGNIRMTFIVSDGLYFGEGPMNQMQQEQLAAPLVSAATNLLTEVIDQTNTSEQDAQH